MRYADLIAEDKKMTPREFGEIVQGPDLYLHFTKNNASLAAILKGGFNLRYFGATAKQYGLPELAANDPKGVYATAYDGYAIGADRPYVIFSLAAPANVLMKKGAGFERYGEGDDLKTPMAAYYGCIGDKLSKILLRDNIQVLASGSEYIILDPKLIRIERSSPKA
jgi:hypothetical protein